MKVAHNACPPPPSLHTHALCCFNVKPLPVPCIVRHCSHVTNFGETRLEYNIIPPLHSPLPALASLVPAL